MNTTSESPGRSGCPCCGVGPIVETFRTEIVEVSYDGEPTAVEVIGVPIEQCVACGEEFSGPRAAQVKHQAICRSLDLLNPEEIRRLREQLGLTQAELSRLSGIGEATISRWERGRLLQNRAMDRYLRLLAADPKNVKLLELLRSRSETRREPPNGSSEIDPPSENDRSLIRRFPDLGSDVVRCHDQAQRFSLHAVSFGGVALVTA
ncbi:MAG: type II toxin-antitoxin system MqsA family antitoxin [Isosphaeraceae bacterium]